MKAATLSPALFFMCATFAWGCGPWGPVTILQNPNACAEGVPGDFEAELDQLEISVPSAFPVPPPQNGKTTIEIIREELTAALGHSATAPALVEQYVELRKAMLSCRLGSLSDLRYWNQTKYDSGHPKPPPFIIPKGLLEEFELYATGCAHYYQLENEKAVELFSRLLELPETKRQYRTLWAYYMRGRLSEKTHPERARKDYEAILLLASQGWNDPLHLAWQAIGRLAAVDVREGKLIQAIHTYATLRKRGDATASPSLRFTVGLLLEKRELHAASVRDPIVRRIIAAHILHDTYSNPFEPDADIYRQDEIAWLDTLSKARVVDSPEALTMAWAAYNIGRFTEAKQWLAMAPPQPLVYWLKGKIAILDGDLNSAARWYSKASRETRLSHDAHNPYYHDSEGIYDARNHLPARIHAENGSIRLSQEDYFGAMKALLLSGYQYDFAYIAERIVSLEELLHFTRIYYPLVDDQGKPTKWSNLSQSKDIWEDGYHNARAYAYGVLLRRLTREYHFNEALSYASDQEIEKLQDYIHAYRTGMNRSLPRNDRAQAWSKASRLLAEGEILINPITQGDWEGGTVFGIGWLAQERLTTNGISAPLVSKNERDRIHQYKLPYTHYRTYGLHKYQATHLGLKAADLMPNQSQEKAHWLWLLGDLTKHRDPQFANPIYKRLATDCAHTPLGALANQRHWFPTHEEYLQSLSSGQ